MRSIPGFKRQTRPCIATERGAPCSARTPMKSCIILHIEDDDLDHALFERDLKRLHFKGKYRRAVSFDDAKQSLTQCLATKAECPDLIIADSKLGIYNGLDIVQWIKAQ